MQIALKIDVDTYRGTLQGVPALAAALRRCGAQATFLFSLGPDHTGRSIRRIFRRGFLRKVARTSVGANYGWKTLCYGTLLPGPDIGRKCAGIMRQVRDAGFEVGIHCWDHVRWQDQVTARDYEWTRRELTLAADRFREIFAAPSRTCGAPGWQTSAAALRLQDAMGLACCSDTRGSHPFLPAMGGTVFSCPQLPTTLPTLDELLGTGGLTEAGLAAHLLQLSSRPAPHGHVYTLHAELEGMRYLPFFEELLQGWRERGDELVSLSGLHRTLRDEALPVHEVVMATIPGRSGRLAVQGAAIA